MSEQDPDRMPSYPIDPEGEDGRLDDTSSGEGQSRGTGKGRAVEGLGGTGGSSGSGGVRGQASPKRNLSGIDNQEQPNPEDEDEERPFRDAGENYNSDTRHRISGRGNGGKTNGKFSETIPSSDEGKDPANEKRRSRDQHSG
ncbi:MAG: hypothetical protein OHK0022_35090 [Roseiflexaceae bacterium]